MSLRLKINLIVGVLTALFAAAVIALQYRSLRDSVLEEVVAANRVASQMLQRTVWRFAAQGLPAMRAFLDSMGRVRANDIYLFDEQGRELYRSPHSTYKEGRDAPAWFARLIAPVPTVQSIEFPNGKLEIHANASRAVLDAWDQVIVLGAVLLAALLAVNAAVFWLVGRTVRPFRQIVQALEQLQAGRFDVKLPPLTGSEAATIGAAFNRMVGVLQQNIDNERRALRAERELSDNRALSRWVDHRIEQERLTIARELHDELGQSVTAMRSMALSIAKRIGSRDPQAELAARKIAEESSRLYDAMHGIIPRLTPLVLDSFGLADALDDLAESTRRSQAGVQLELRVDLSGTELPPEQALALYRAAQEGITNALRHGKATHIVLQLRAAGDGSLRLELVDDGQGLAPDWAQRTGHYGLRWLAERVEAVGGRMHIEPSAPRGVRLSVQLPLGEAGSPPLRHGAAADARAAAGQGTSA